MSNLTRLTVSPFMQFELDDTVDWQYLDDIESERWATSLDKMGRVRQGHTAQGIHVVWEETVRILSAIPDHTITTLHIHHFWRDFLAIWMLVDALGPIRSSLRIRYTGAHRFESDFRDAMHRALFNHPLNGDDDYLVDDANTTRRQALRAFGVTGFHTDLYCARLFESGDTYSSEAESEDSQITESCIEVDESDGHSDSDNE